MMHNCSIAIYWTNACFDVLAGVWELWPWLVGSCEGDTEERRTIGVGRSPSRLCCVGYQLSWDGGMSWCPVDFEKCKLPESGVVQLVSGTKIKDSRGKYLSTFAVGNQERDELRQSHSGQLTDQGQGSCVISSPP